MVDYINMQQEEYDEMQQQLGILHIDIIKGESEIRQAIQSLVDYGGGMYGQSISMKVLNLLQQMDWVIALIIAKNFELSEQKIVNFINYVIDTDVTVN